jgi:hypothetical protein
MKTSFKIKSNKDSKGDYLTLKYKDQIINIYFEEGEYIYNVSNATSITLRNAISTVTGLLKSATTIAKGIEHNVGNDTSIHPWALLLEVIEFYSPSFLSKIAKDYESNKFILCIIEDEAYPAPACMYKQVQDHLDGSNIEFPTKRITGYEEVLEEFWENYNDKSLFVAKDANALNKLISETLFGIKKKK